MDFDVTQEMKELAQKTYYKHRELWLKRILYIIKTNRYKALPIIFEGCEMLCMGCGFSDNLDKYILGYDTGCYTCLYKLINIRGEEVESCDNCDTIYDKFLNVYDIEEKLRLAWEIYYWPMADIWMI